jgi:TatD DNase family protein
VQLELARCLSVPVVIHSRNADEETYTIIQEYEHQALPGWPKDRPLGIMHCFAGDLPLALRYIELGFLISIPAACTYPNAERTRAVAGGIPCVDGRRDRRPYIPPQSKRGGQRPAFICETVQCIADIRGAVTRISPTAPRWPPPGFSASATSGSRRQRARRVR